MAWFSCQVKFEEDISKVIPKDKKINKLNEVFQNSKFLDKLVVMVSMKDTATQQPDSLVEYADSFANEAQIKLEPYISKINARVDDGLVMDLFNTITDRLPIYLSEKDYKAIDTLIEPGKIKETLAQNLRTLTSFSAVHNKYLCNNNRLEVECYCDIEN